MSRIVASLIPAVALALLTPVAASAQGGAAGAIGGAAAGAAVGGPVGAAVGGVVGAVIGAEIAPPPAPVVTYVTSQPVPTTAVTLEGNLVVGATIPETVVLTPIPADVYAVPAGGVTYGYAFINGQKVIVDTNTHAIVAIVG